MSSMTELLVLRNYIRESNITEDNYRMVKTRIVTALWDSYTCGNITHVALTYFMRQLYHRLVVGGHISGYRTAAFGGHYSRRYH